MYCTCLIFNYTFITCAFNTMMPVTLLPCTPTFLVLLFLFSSVFFFKQMESDDSFFYCGTTTGDLLAVSLNDTWNVKAHYVP